MQSTILSDSPVRLVLGLLPPAAMLLAAALIARARPRRPGRTRESLLIAAMLTAVWVVLGTELLSLFRAFSFWPVLAWWAIPAGALGVAWALGRHVARAPADDGRESMPGPWWRLPWGVWAPAGMAAGLVLLAGAVVLRSPPNIRDTTIYHLPRQVYWMQQRSVEHYPTDQFLQLAMPPLSEFAGLHLFILSGGDHYASLVQWLALALGAAAASLVALELAGGGRALAQAVAALLVVANPMAWVQATNPKNDVVAALWVLVLAFWVARTLRDGRCGPGRWLAIGVAAGLATPTKPTGAIYCLPLLAVLGLWLVVMGQGWIGTNWRGGLAVLPLAATVLVAVLALNAGHFGRNLRVFGTPHWTGEIVHRGRPLTNETRAPGALASVLVRNVALHAGTPSTALNGAVERAVERFHEWLGLRVNDPRTTAYERFKVRYMPWSDSVAGAPVHLALVVLAIVALAVGAVLGVRRAGGPVRATLAIPPPEAARLGAMLAAALGGFVLFCVLLKWQPWHARLHVGVVSVLAPVLATCLCRGGAWRGSALRRARRADGLGGGVERATRAGAGADPAARRAARADARGDARADRLRPRRASEDRRPGPLARRVHAAVAPAARARPAAAVQLPVRARRALARP